MRLSAVGPSVKTQNDIYTEANVKKKTKPL